MIYTYNKGRKTKKVKIPKIELYALIEMCYVLLAKLEIVNNVPVSHFLLVRMQIIFAFSTAT